jgi:hypothetical protein
MKMTLMGSWLRLIEEILSHAAGQGALQDSAVALGDIAVVKRPLIDWVVFEAHG